MSAFSYTAHPQEIRFGPAALDQLPAALDRLRPRSVLLCSAHSQVRAGRVARIEALLGERLACTYAEVRPHVPERQVREALDLAISHGVDAVLALGGGSAIGVAKAVGVALDERRNGKPPGEGELWAITGAPVIAVPTTYVGSELTPVYGVTRLVDGEPVKQTISDVRAVPRLVLYDPELTLDLPPELTAGTGINALAHGIEALYSTRWDPLSTAAATAGIRAISDALPLCHRRGDDLEARAELMEGAFLAALALAHVAMGLHHGLCHVLGGAAGVPHGAANAIILPHAMRFNLPSAAPQLALAAEAMGARDPRAGDEGAATAAIENVRALVAELHLPSRLRDVGVEESSLPHLARLALQSQAVRENPRPVRDAAELEALLREAW